MPLILGRAACASRGIGRGLAKIEPTNSNTMIAFAAKAGSTASDGDAKNSPFAAALVERLPTPGLDVRKAFGFVRDDVLKNTGYQQEPYVYGSLGGDDVPLVPAKPAAATGPQASPDDAIRRGYELALQAGDRDAWEAFLRAFPSGFYADLAKVQLKKIAAEETRAIAADKARQAEEEKARLTADRAKKAEQEKAAVAAKAAEDARLAAEKGKEVEEAKAAAAEQRRKDAEAAVAKALADKQAAAELATKQAAEKKTQVDSEQKVAAVAPTSSQPGLSPQETAKLVQSELRRVGCLAAVADGSWNAKSQRSLTLFNKYAGTKFDTAVANLDALDAIKAKQGRVCPLVCDNGFRVDGDQCAKIACRAGYRVNDDNECERVSDKKPVATGEPSRSRDVERQVEPAPKAQARSSAQIVCDRGGCRPTRAGCRLETYQQGKHGVVSYGGNVEVCN